VKNALHGQLQNDKKPLVKLSHCETRRVVKINPKGCNAIKLMERVVFQNCSIYHLLHGK
jgi:hypothetical protein